MRFIDFLREVKRPKYESLNKIEIHKNHILENITFLSCLYPAATLIPVLKSNAYGHGLKQIASILEATDLPLLAVDSFPEALALYSTSSKNILVLGEHLPSVYQYFDPRRTEFCVYNIETLRHISQVHKKPRVHLFVNTGMHREGIGDLPYFLHQVRSFSKDIEIVGICSHFASADITSDLNQKQKERFSSAVRILKISGLAPHLKYIHLGNSAGIFHTDLDFTTTFRSGYAMYGYNPFSPTHEFYTKSNNLKPALRVFSHIVALQKICKGESVSYNETWKAKEDTIIAVIAFGYADGLRRGLSNKGFCYVGKDKEKCVPVVGNVCMNLTCLDIGCDESIKIGDEVEVFSDDPNKKNSFYNVASQLDTIPYEIMTGLNPMTRRIIV